MMLWDHLKNILALALLTTVLAGSGSGQPLQDADREKWERVPQLLAVLQLKPGARVADVGAGDGFYTERMARVVAPTGRVTAVDISEPALAQLKERMRWAGLTNVDVVLGRPADPCLASGVYDVVLVYNSYHEMTDHEAMLEHLYRALKVGGRLVMVEPIHDKNHGLSRSEQVALHEIALELVEPELRRAGFKVRNKVASFIRFTELADPGSFWLLRATRPGK